MERRTRGASQRVDQPNPIHLTNQAELICENESVPFLPPPPPPPPHPPPTNLVLQGGGRSVAKAEVVFIEA